MPWSRPSAPLCQHVQLAGAHVYQGVRCGRACLPQLMLCPRCPWCSRHAGVRLQDEAAEDPLMAAERGLAPNTELYWRNKLQVTAGG